MMEDKLNTQFNSAANTLFAHFIELVRVVTWICGRVLKKKFLQYQKEIMVPIQPRLKTGILNKQVIMDPC